MENSTSVHWQPLVNKVIDHTTVDEVIDLTTADDGLDPTTADVVDLLAEIADEYGTASPKDSDFVQKNLNLEVNEDEQPQLSQDGSAINEKGPEIDLSRKHLQRVVTEDQGDVTPHQPVTDFGVHEKTVEKFMTETDQLINKIQQGRAQEMQSISFDGKVFSSFSNLQPIQHSNERNGSFGCVRYMHDTKTKETLVCKLVKDVTKLNRIEIKAALELSEKPCIACVLGFGYVKTSPCLVLENAGISLFEAVKDGDLWRQLMEPGQLLCIMFDIFTAVSALSQHGYTHRDIKPQNICVDPHTLGAKVIDLGSCHKNGEKREECGLTLEYLDPCHARAYYKEIQKQETFPPLEEKDDVYAVGLVLLFIMTRIHPMIFVGIGQRNYTIPNDPKKRAESLKNERVSVLQMMSHLVDEPSPDCREPQYRLKDKINQLLREFQCKLTPPLQEVVDRVLVVDKNCRASAEEMVNFLKKYLHPEIGQSFKAGSVSVPEEEFLDLSNKQNIGLTQQDQPEPGPVPAKLLNVKTRQPPGFGQPSSDTDHPPAKMARKDHQGTQE